MSRLRVVTVRREGLDERLELGTEVVLLEVVAEERTPRQDAMRSAARVLGGDAGELAHQPGVVARVALEGGERRPRPVGDDVRGHRSDPRAPDALERPRDPAQRRLRTPADGLDHVAAEDVEEILVQLEPGPVQVDALAAEHERVVDVARPARRDVLLLDAERDRRRVPVALRDRLRLRDRRRARLAATERRQHERVERADAGTR